MCSRCLGLQVQARQCCLQISWNWVKSVDIKQLQTQAWTPLARICLNLFGKGIDGTNLSFDLKPSGKRTCIYLKHLMVFSSSQCCSIWGELLILFKKKIYEAKRTGNLWKLFSFFIDYFIPGHSLLSRTLQLTELFKIRKLQLFPYFKEISQMLQKL